MDVPKQREERRPLKRVPPTSMADLSDRPEGWKLYRASNGLPFYFNRVTGESVWARQATPSTTAENPTRIRRDGTYNGVEDPRPLPKQRTGTTKAPLVPDTGMTSSSNSFSISPSSSWSSSSSERDYKKDSESSTTTSDGSYHISNSSSSSSSNSRGGQSSTSESFVLESDSSSDDSWTGSMECRFRRLVRSVEGRKMLAEEVRVLTSQSMEQGQRRRRRTEKANSSRQHWGTTKRREGLDAEDCCGTNDVEVAFLERAPGEGCEHGDSEASSRSSSSSSSGDSGLSLLSDDVVLRKLEGIGRTLIVVQNAAYSVLRMSCAMCAGVANYVTDGFLETLRRWTVRMRFSIDGAFRSASA